MEIGPPPYVPGEPGKLPGQQEAGASPERPTMPDELLSRTQETGLYTVEGKDFIIEFKNALQSADIERVRLATEESIAYMEGLNYGALVSHYDLEDELVVSEIRDMFTSVEGSIDRPGFQYVFSAVRAGLTEAVREANRFNDQVTRYGNSPEEKERGLTEWRVAFGGERRRHWQLVSDNYRRQGLEPLNEETIEMQVAVDTSSQETRLKNWFQSKNELNGLKHHLDARVLYFDRAFRERQSTCENEEDQVSLSGKGIKPDIGAWTGFYWGNRKGERWRTDGVSDWGDAVSRVEAAIEDIGLGKIPIEGLKDNPAAGWYARDIYVNGFSNTAEFTKWFRTIAKHSVIDGKERMDVVWAAWRMSVWKEKITKLAWKVDLSVDEKTGQVSGKYVFGNPPFASDLMQKALHSEKMRANELGWKGLVIEGGVKKIIDWDTGKKIVLDANGKETGTELITEDDFKKQPDRYRHFKALSHSGHPLSIGRIGRLVEDFMTYQTFEGNDGKKTSLQEAWRGKNGNGVSMGSNKFPFISLEHKEPGEPSDEQAAGGVGLWFLNRLRASTVRKDLRSVPKPHDLSVEFFQGSNIRMWEKIKKIVPGELDKDGVPQNPFVWYLAGVLRARSPREVNKKGEYVQGDRGLRSADNNDKTIANIKAERASEQLFADYDIINNALLCGVISKAERDWYSGNILNRESTLREHSSDVLPGVFGI